MSSAQKQTLEWISNLRFLALIAVIILHTTSVLLMQYGKVPLGDWLIADAFNAMVRFAVPVFVMITGALNLGKEYELSDFLKRRLLRIVTPFIFWSLVYVGYSWYNEDIVFNKDTWGNIKLVLHQLKYGSSYHLWYVYMLIGLYLIIPVIGKFVRAASNKELIYFLIVWIIVITFNQPYLNRYKPQIELRYFEGYLGYLVLGYYLTRININIRRFNLLMLCVFILMVVLITVCTYLITKNGYTTTTLFYEPLGPFAVVLSGSMFLAIRYSKPHLPDWMQRVRDFTGQYAFGIYLSHALILYLLDLWFDITNKFANPLISIPSTALLCLALSTVLTWLLNKIPYIGKHIGG